MNLDGGDICQVCKGTGRERHKYVREDGELVEELLVCELCKGVGRIDSKCKNPIDTFIDTKTDLDF